MTVWQIYALEIQQGDQLQAGVPVEFGLLATVLDRSEITRYGLPYMRLVVAAGSFILPGDVVVTVDRAGTPPPEYSSFDLDVAEVLDSSTTAAGMLARSLFVGPGEPIAVDAGVRALFARTASTSEHAATIAQAATSGSGVALNVASSNPDDSAMYLNGPSTTRGVLKISHDGRVDGSDDAASGLSIDLRTAGSKARGIYLWSTHGGQSGDPVTVRVSSAVTALTREDFVIKANGRCGLGTGLGSNPAGQIEIAPTDDTTPGIVTRGRAAGTNQQEWRRPSDGAVRTRVSNTAQLVTQEISYFTGPGVMVGSTSTQLGGGSVGVIGVANAGTVPASNPTGGGVLYAEGGALKWRGSSGTITTIAPA